MPPAKQRHSLLYRVGETVEVRDVDPPIMATVGSVTDTLLRVAYHDAEGRLIRRWVAAGVVRQMTISAVMRRL